MARLNEGQGIKVVRVSRYFSEDFKKKKVAEIERRVTSVAEICRQYEVSSPAVYKWIYKYSLMKKKGIKMVVESQSDTTKIKALKQHVCELEQLLGQKQFEIDFLKKQMELASEQYGVDLKKKRFGKRSPGSGNTEKNTFTK
jgi:transposase